MVGSVVLAKISKHNSSTIDRFSSLVGRTGTKTNSVGTLDGVSLGEDDGAGVVGEAVGASVVGPFVGAMVGSIVTGANVG